MTGMSYDCFALRNVKQRPWHFFIDGPSWSGTCDCPRACVFLTRDGHQACHATLKAKRFFPHHVIYGHSLTATNKHAVKGSIVNQQR
eukprot:356781-Chlamydomonas_euryale.AAC.6